MVSLSQVGTARPGEVAARAPAQCGSDPGGPCPAARVLLSPGPAFTRRGTRGARSPRDGQSGRAAVGQTQGRRFGGTAWQRRRPSFPPERPMHPLPAAFALLAATQMAPLCHLPSGTEDAGRTRATPVFLSPHLLNINKHTTPILRHLNFPRYFPQFSCPSGSVSLAAQDSLTRWVRAGARFTGGGI